METMNQRALRMKMDYLEGGRRPEDYKHSDIHRNLMLQILRDPTNFSDEVKISTLLRFHKDTCANLLLRLYSSIVDASKDMEILKEFEPILEDLNIKDQLTLQDAAYHDLRAKKQLFQMKADMSVFLKSSDSPLLEDEHFKKWMLQKSQCEDDVDYHNDEERLEGVEEAICRVLDNLRTLGADMSKYQDDDLNFQINDREATINQYTLLEDKATKTSEKVSELLEYGHPCASYISDLKRQVQILEKESAEGTVEKKAGSRSGQGKRR
ncbi:uncharacterized protein LOC113279546 [Papaver somniferum]|uniref:uncharacterized protein LOC113279546 n=1 Tax=Papaver somniferum TaxID=3469 RepID=UPI000E6F89C7|nr:uncharacterized protein LOC113279546 [Papaver somniferum]